FANLATVFSDRPIRRLYLVNFLIYLASFGFFRVILMYMVDEWHWTESEETLGYAALAGCSIVASFGIMPRLIPHYPMKTIAMVSAIVGGLATMAIVVPRSELPFMLVTSLAAMILTLTLAACAALLSSAVSEDRQGSVMGNNQALQVGGEAAGAF